ncbi:MAG: glycosyl transferase, partial [Oribacterium sp.]|nr:glycosyl transferase [Oribacterium sp.]
MKYGYFDDAAREYVITTPKTPLPWINYLGNKEFFSLISNTCGGYSFYKDAKLLRLTRYRYNNVPYDNNGKYFYVKDRNRNTVWNPGWQPVKTDLDSYECRHGLGYSRFTSSKDGVEAELLTFVPMEDNCEISRITLTNKGQDTAELSLFSYVEWCLWNADDDMKNFQRNLSTGEVEVSGEGSVLFHKTEYRERRNHYAILGVNSEVSGFDTSRDAFLGAYNGPDHPDVVISGKCTDSVASGWSPIASQQIDLSLAPGESRTFIFTLGYIENEENDKWEAPSVINKKRAFEMLSRYDSEEKVNCAFEELRSYWNELLSIYHVSSSNEKVDRMVNIWNQYQCLVTFNMSRSASYYESGIGRGMGFRDSCQDLLGFVHLIPDRARQRIIDIASTQFPDGSAYHQYQPLTKKGNSDIGSGF